MTSPLELTPRPPEWQLDWAAIHDAYDWIRDLAGCVQDADHHAEGDVAAHTRLVCEALTGSPEWRALPPHDRSVLFAAALLHDVGKPERTRVQSDGRITTRGHSIRGSVLARQLLWELDTPFHLREQVAALVRHHQVPFFAIEQPEPDAHRRAIAVSQSTRCDHLALLANADARGRHSITVPRLLDNVALFAELCRELDCLAKPFSFPSDHSRFLYFQREDRDPTYLAYDDTRLEVTLMSGLPGAGKDFWIATYLSDRPVISLDGLREELGVEPTEPQGPVRAVARERAREFLRAGSPFIWNATNVSRQFRAESIRLFASYHARVRIVYVEAPAVLLYEQNRQRPTTVPTAAIERILDRWEVPDLTEAHQVDWYLREL